MSKRKTQRKPNKLVVLNEALQLCKYMVERTANTQDFPRRSRWQTTDRLLGLAINIHLHIRRANNVNVNSWADYERRRALQDQAIEEADDFLGLLDIIDFAHPLKDSTLGVLSDTASAIYDHGIAWRDKDYLRYTEVLGDPMHTSTAAALRPPRSPNPSNANNVRNSNGTDASDPGRLNNNNANNANRPVPDCVSKDQYLSFEPVESNSCVED